MLVPLGISTCSSGAGERRKREHAVRGEELAGGNENPAECSTAGAGGREKSQSHGEPGPRPEAGESQRRKAGTAARARHQGEILCLQHVGLYLSQADKASKEVCGMQQGYIRHQGEILCLQHMRKSARLAW